MALLTELEKIILAVISTNMPPLTGLNDCRLILNY